MSHYIHGSAPEEQARLSRLNQLINARCAKYLTLAPGNRVLDMGSGLGQFTRLMAECVGTTGYCLGVEREANQLAWAQQHVTIAQLVFKKGDAYHLPFGHDDWQRFDFVHMRFLLEHLAEPARAVQQAYKALQPGGKILLADDDHEAMILFPEPPGFKALWAAYMDSYVEVGNDPFIGRKLPKLLLDAGFNQIYNDVVFFGDCHGTETFNLFAVNLIEVIGTAKQIMLEADLLSIHAYETAIQSLWQWSNHEHAAMWYTIAVAGGVKPATDT
jgi:ubiquinone/menaquinone biosynthesis C-methylase UbiE